MSSLVVGVGDMRVARAGAGPLPGVFGGANSGSMASLPLLHNNGSTEGTLVTYALGSCIGLMVYDRVARVGGMLHYMLPDSAIDLEKAAANPAMFADVGIPLLFRSCYQLGAEKKRMVAYAAGGAEPLTGFNSFEIGRRNQLALKKILWKAGVILRGESLGGTLSRTVRLELATGRIGMRTGAGIEECMYDPDARDGVRQAGRQP